MDEFNVDYRFVKSDHVQIRTENFGATVFDKRNWSISEINSIGLKFLDSLDRKQTLRENINSFVDESEYTQDSDDHPVLNYCQALYDKGIIKSITDCDTKAKTVQNRDVVGEISNNILEEGINQYDTSKNSYLKAPLFIWWDITYTCNLNCKQCYSRSGSTTTPELNTFEAKKMIEQFANAGVFYIYFLGGEPLMREDFLELVEHTVSLDMGVMINTNGWFVDASMAKKLKTLGVHHVRVSIDGANAKTHDAIRGKKGSFDKTIQAVKNLNKAGIPIVSIAPTVMKENVDEIDKLIDLAFKLNVSEIQLIQMAESGRAKKENLITSEDILMLKKVIVDKKRIYPQMIISASETLIDDKDKPFKKEVSAGTILPRIMGCAGGRTSCSISADGYVLHCLHHRQKIGDLKTTSFEDIWFNAPLFQQARTVKKTCQDCQFSSVCSGLCPIDPMANPVKEKMAKLFTDKNSQNSSDDKCVPAWPIIPEIRPYIQIDAPRCLDTDMMHSNSSDQVYNSCTCPCVSPCYCMRPYS